MLYNKKKYTIWMHDGTGFIKNCRSDSLHIGSQLIVILERRKKDTRTISILKKKT